MPPRCAMTTIIPAAGGPIRSCSHSAAVNACFEVTETLDTTLAPGLDGCVTPFGRRDGARSTPSLPHEGCGRQRDSGGGFDEATLAGLASAPAGPLSRRVTQREHTRRPRAGWRG